MARHAELEYLLSPRFPELLAANGARLVSYWDVVDAHTENRSCRPSIRARGTPLSAYHRARELVARGHEVDILTYGVGEEPPPGLRGARVSRPRAAFHRDRSARVRRG